MNITGKNTFWTTPHQATLPVGWLSWAQVSRRRDVNRVVDDGVGGDAKRADHPQPGNSEERPQDPTPSAEWQPRVGEEEQRKHHADDRRCPRGLHQHGERAGEHVAIALAVVEHGVHRRVRLDDEKECRREQDPPHTVAGLPTGHHDSDQRERHCRDNRRWVGGGGHMVELPVERNHRHQ